ncbi:MAG TPA: NnrS family protein [Sulfuricurvum sp.]|nr:NnrS family protein [Sulfuricurvum sp.]
MKFTTTGIPESFSPPPKPKHYFLSQPHQPFFFFGMVWAIVSMVLFTLSHKGTLSLSIAENLFHLYTLSFIVLIQFFHGFLFTTFPRFCMSAAISKEQYGSIVWLYQIFGLLFFLGSVASEWTVLVAMVGMLAVQAMAYSLLLRAYRTGKSPQNSDPFWILIAHSIGIGAHAVLVITFAAAVLGYSGNWVTAISPVVTHLFLVFLTFIAAQRMIPFFSHSMEVRAPYFVARVFALLVLKTGLSLAMLPLAEAAVSLLLGSYLLWEFVRWKLPLFRSSAILWVLYLALFWLPIGLIAGGLMQLAEVYTDTSWLFGGTHLLVLGFITTVLIGFGTRVTLGHSGQTPHADTLTATLFVWTQVVVLLRFGLSIDSAFTAAYPWLFDAAALGWIVLFAVWMVRYGRILLFGR